MLEIEDDTVSGGFNITPRTALYRAEINDPQLANAGQTHIIFEMLHTIDFAQSQIKTLGQNKKDQVKVYQLTLKLVKSIMQAETLPSEFLNQTPYGMLQTLA